ncbi:tetratricopeptide repeat protein [Pseudidiomarina salilacus]|uniref:tetratricopeptide repeat protein n=1 Tax=Pseudidiomarina salilacus TaxID=3384452 RepID=UPI003984A54A
MKNQWLLVAMLTSSVLISQPILAQEAAASTAMLETVQQRWAEVNYTLSEDAQEDAFAELEQQALAWTEAEPNNAEAFIWLGIVRSTYAGAKGGLGALGLAKAAKKSLEHALTLDPTALQGSAYGSLGTLYYKVPGWPFGFGDEDKAQELLQKALEINPDGIDPNYFYADYLYEQGHYAKAKTVAEHALAAAPRPHRPRADAERRREVEALLARIAKKVR